MSTMEEESFPRGGAEEHDETTKKKKRKHKVEKELFTSSNDGETKPKKKKDRHVTLEKRVAAKKVKDREVDHLIKKGLSTICQLTAASCPENMLILGCIKEVYDYFLEVSLPNALTGKVPITAISATYTARLQELANGDFSRAGEIKNLRDLFRVGMVVRCKVTQISNTDTKKPKITLTMDARDINGVIPSTQIKDGMVLCGCVSSVEDHGYVVDLGVSGLVAFLKKKAAESYIEDYNDGKALYVGSYLHCMVSCDDKVEMMTGESRTVQVTIKPRKAFRTKLTTEMGIKMNMLLPGMRVVVKVHKVLDKGVRVQFLSYTGTIHRSHLANPLNKLQPGDELSAAILYIHPVTKVMTLTCHTHLLTPDLAPRCLFGDLHYGKIVEDGKVIKVDTKKGVYLKLGEMITGYAHLGNVSDGEVKDLNKKFPKGSTVKCRVMGFDYCDNLVLLTLKQSILDREFLSYQDIHPAQDLEVEVRNVTKGGVNVIIANHLKGFIPNTHMADAPLKHPERRFTPGIKINVRVLTVKTEDRKIILTAKKSILTSSCPKLTEYEQAKVHDVLEGVVNKITDKGLRLLFYNGVKGFVPKSFLSTEFIDDPSKVFFVGQVVKGQVIRADPENEKLVLSLQIKDFNTKKTKGKKGEGTAAGKPIVNVDIGMLLDVEVVGKTDRGLFVKSSEPALQAFLPLEHLSDSLLNAKLKHAMYEIGDTITNCIVLSCDKRVTVTKKPGFVTAAQEGTLIKTFEDIKLGAELPGSIRNHMEYGVFVDLAAGLVGLVPLKFICNQKVSNAAELFPTGMSVVVKVSEINVEKKRLLLSLRMKDCYHDNIQTGVNLLNTYIKETADIIEKYRTTAGDKQLLVQHHIGQVVTVTVTKVTKDQGVLCTLEDGTKAVATDDHTREVDCKKGQSYPAVVLYVDLIADCLEVSLNSRFVTQVKTFSKNKFTRARVDQVIKSEVQLIKDDFVLVSLKGHAQGSFAYLPAKRHLNDVLERRQYQITQQNAVVIQQNKKDCVLAVLQIHNKEKKNDGGDKKKDRQEISHALTPGIVVKAKIKTVHDHQLNIEIAGVPGRVHISEVTDKFKQGTNPLKRFVVDKEYKVKVVGYRHLKTKKHLPIKSSEIWKSLPECSLRPGCINTNGLQHSEDIHKSVLRNGQQLTVYIQNFNKETLWVDITPKYRGKILKKHISTDKKVQEDPFSHYKRGCAYKATIIGPCKANVYPMTLVEKPIKVELDKDSISATLDAGTTVTGIVTTATCQGVFVDLGLGRSGRIHPTDIADTYVDQPWMKFSVGEEVKVYIVSQENPKKCVLSTRPSRLLPALKMKKKTVKIENPELSLVDVEVGKLVSGFISNNSNRNKMFVSLGRDVGALIKTHKLSEIKLRSPANIFTIGKVVHGKVVKVIKTKVKTTIRLSLLESDTGLPDVVTSNPAYADIVEDARIRQAKLDAMNQEATVQVKESDDEDDDSSDDDSNEDDHDEEKTTKVKKRKTSESAADAPKAKKSKKDQVKDAMDVEVSEDSDSGVEDDIRLSSPPAMVKAGTQSLSLAAGFSWDADVTLPPPGSTGDKHQDSDSESEDDAVADKKKPKTRKTRAERLAAQREEERQLVEKERKVLDGDTAPQSAEDFDRLVLQSPDSSMIWLSYMAHHLESTEIEKARAVAERALKTISFREEQEKQNVWVAYLNLENMYGTPELLKLVFDRAVQHNDALKIHNQLASIYIKSEKDEAADQLYTLMLRKFSSVKDVWINYGVFLFTHKKTDAARKLMQRTLKAINQKHHLEVLSKFAQMEYKHGEPERGTTMFENVLNTYPGRTDLWSVYIDMVIKHAQHQQVRNIFERVMKMKFAAKKMKFFFKKQLDFEEKFGNEETVAAVKQKALDYVEARAALT